MPSALIDATLATGALGATVGLVALLLDRPWRFRTAVLGGALCVTPVLVALLYVVLGAAVRVWDDHPETARVASIVLVVLLALASIGAHATRTGSDPRSDEGEDEDGGGGGGWRPDPPPRAPTPAGPVVPDAPWGEFDDLRRGWERVPAGRH